VTFLDVTGSGEERDRGGSVCNRAEAAAVEDLAEERLPLLPASCASLELRRCGPGVLAVASERPAAFTATHQRWISKMGRLLEQSMELEG